VVIVDDLSNSKAGVVDRIETIAGKRPAFYRVDIKDREKLTEVFQKEKPDAVINFAGFKAVGESVQKPLMYYRNNLEGAITLLEVMGEQNCKRFVFSSSATVYGPVNPVPYVEGMPTSATNPYGWTKVMIEQFLRDLVVADKEWSVVSLRYFNPIGAHESGLIGEDPNGIPNNLMPYISKVALGKLPMLHVFGNDYDTPDGTGVRDYIHVVDLAQGHLKAIEYAMSHTGVEEINLGTGKGTSVLELVAAFERNSGAKVPYVIEGRRAGDLAYSYANAEKAERLLGWHTKLDVDQMCRSSWNWQKKNPDGYTE
jgi:UDP-glucose 4-epimerase